jgi:cytochrome c-type biogenesis protein CcmH
VRLAPHLADAVAPEDVLFVYARPVNGARMPLAVFKRTAKELPLDFTLDETMAMAPGNSLSSHVEVFLVARVSKSGSAAPQSGDLQGSTGPVKVGSSGSVVVIDRRLP